MGTEPAPLRAAMAACGGIASLSLEAARRSADFRIVAIQDPREQALRSVGERYGIAARHRDFAGLLGEEIDFAIINTPNDCHREQVEQAALAGVPCLVQKPMAPTLAEARAMAAAARRAGLALGVLLCEHSSPLNHQLAAMVRTGWLGEPVLVQALMAHDLYLEQPPPAGDWRRDPIRVGGGAFIQLAVHHIDLARWILGREVERIGLIGARGKTVFADESAVACALFEGGVTAQFAASYATSATRFLVAGTAGAIELSAEHLLVRGREPFRGEVFAYEEVGREQHFARAAIDAAARPLEPRYEIHGRFARWLRDGEEYPCPAEWALRDMEVLEAAYRSRAEGRVLSLA